MALMNSKEFAEVARQYQQILRIERDLWNEYLFTVGCNFCEKWFQNNLEVLSHSNFWDLWTVEFIKDDELLIRKFLEQINESDTGTREQKYYRYKMAMIADRALYRTIDNFLQYEQSKQQKITPATE